MTAADLRYRWTPQAFLRADAARVFDGRVELVDGQVWPVVIGDWHGPTTMRSGALLGGEGLVVTQQTLPAGESLPDPDMWVRRTGAVPTGSVSARVSRWNAADVLLVVEVSDETVLADLTTKAKLYGAAGFGCLLGRDPRGRARAHRPGARRLPQRRPLPAGPAGAAAARRHDVWPSRT